MDKSKTKTTQLVFDFGGGTLDVSVIEVDKEKFEVKGIAGDSFLGGRDFDKKIYQYFINAAKNELLKKKDKRFKDHLLRVKKSCIRLKRKLSVREEVVVDLDHFGRNEFDSIPLTISRKKFEEISNDLFVRAIELITQCLDDLELTKNDINEVLLIGGTTRIPKVKEMLKNYFSSEKIKTDLNPDEAVVLGAAVQAAIWKKDCRELEKYKIIDVTPLTLGFSLRGDLFRIAIKKHTKLPAKSDIIKTCTSKNNQRSTYRKIYEGERKNCKFNTLLAKIVIDDLPPGRAGDVSLNTTFNLDEDGILTVECGEISEENNQKVTVSIYDHWISQKKIKSTLREAKRHKEEDDIFENLVKYRSKIRDYCNYILYDINKIDPEQRTEVEKNCNEILKYSDNVDDKSIEDLRTKFEAIKQKIDPVIKNKIKVKSVA